jgi:hypothetical protein
MPTGCARIEIVGGNVRVDESDVKGGESMEETNFVEIDVQEESFVEIEGLVDDTAELSAEALCACGCGMGLCVIRFDVQK